MRLSDRVPTDPVTRKPDLHQPLDTLGAQVRMKPSLHDTEERLIVSAMCLLAPLGPRSRAPHGCRHEFLVGRVRRTLVELHDDVGPECLLHGHVVLGGPLVPHAVHDASEAHPVIGE